MRPSIGWGAAQSTEQVVLLRPGTAETPSITDLAPYTAAQTSLDGHATAYVCQNFVCAFPTTDAAAMLGLLEGKTKPDE